MNMIKADQITNNIIAIPDEQNDEYNNASNEHTEPIIHLQNR